MSPRQSGFSALPALLCLAMVSGCLALVIQTLPARHGLQEASRDLSQAVQAVQKELETLRSITPNDLDQLMRTHPAAEHVVAPDSRLRLRRHLQPSPHGLGLVDVEIQASWRDRDGQVQIRRLRTVLRGRMAKSPAA